MVDRRFNRARYDAEAIGAAFSVHLREAIDLETVRHQLLLAVGGTVQPAHASLWIKPSAPRRTASRSAAEYDGGGDHQRDQTGDKAERRLE